uniref:Uncharacterized protein n=1 Tax=Leptocylindrus danicus TaxID=163516 RepID=A0A7S2NV69_9STRA
MSTMSSSRFFISRRLFSTGNAKTTIFKRPPTYGEQIDQGIPFGKRKVYGKQRQVVLQTLVGITIFGGFIAAPFVGKKLAQQDAQVLQWVPWADFTVSKHLKSSGHVNTKEDLHRSMIEYQREMHERAINGEFADDAPKKKDADKDVERSVYWRPSLADGPRDPHDDNDDDDDDGN